MSIDECHVEVLTMDLGFIKRSSFEGQRSRDYMMTISNHTNYTVIYVKHLQKGI